MKDLSPKDPFIIYPLVDLLKSCGRIAEALDLQKHAVALNPLHAGAQRQLAELLIEHGAFVDAADAAARALELSRNSDHLWLMAYLLTQRGDRQAAQELLRGLRAGQTAPRQFMAFPGFQRALSETG